ncbi:MAG: family 2 glycosyl transferase [Microgenomates group bacterium Gr01-1014_16]|nr:MAG: family 2 glycosyl transferase [Microgenomates group bacterium Gr01-1014_16]
MAKITVICTVFNEVDTLPDLRSSLSRQTLKPSEIIIVDGGSTDGTWEYLKHQQKIRYFQKIGNRSVGRNFAISKSKCPIIAITDAGCIPEPNWLEELTKQPADVISGYYRGIAKTIFQKCLIPYVLVMPDKAGKREFYPSTRSMAIRKSVWAKFKFNEKLWHNEDYAYAHTLKQAGYSFYFAPKAIVNWMPRKNLKEASWMFVRFAIGDIQAGIFRPQVKNLMIRYAIGLYVFFLALEINILLYPLILFAICYLLFAILKNYRYVKDLRAFFWLPVLQITADLSVISGSLIGFMSKAYGVF